MRWGWIAFRGLKPALLVLGCSLVALILLQAFAGAFAAIRQSQPSQAWSYWFWLSTAGLVATVGGFYWRCFAWERGWHNPCGYCGGPLGWLRGGVVMYGKQLPDYRRCWNCNRPDPES